MIRITVAELIEAWTDWAEAKPKRSNEVDNYRPLIALLLELYGPTPAAAFGPKDFRLVRDELVRRGRARTGINRTMIRLRTLWRWAAAQELVPVERVTALSMVRGLRAGESDAVEPAPVLAVDWEDVQATLPHLSSVVRSMVLLAWHTGARPGEICRLRPCDVDVNGSDGVWIATITDHKTKHHDPRKARYLALGPAAREIVAPYLGSRRTDAPLFSPAEAIEEMFQRRAAARTTRPGQGNVRGSNRQKNPRKKAGSAYTSQAFARAVHVACERAFPGEEQAHRRWSPSQLRHSFASRVREQLDLVAASEALGHSDSEITARHYAERSKRAAVRAVLALGA